MLSDKELEELYSGISGRLADSSPFEESTYEGSLEELRKKYPTQEEIDAEPGVLKRGLIGGGVYGTGSLATGAAGMLADIVGADETAQSLLETSQDIAGAGQEKYPQKVNFDQMLDDPSLSNIGEWLGYNVAAAAPMMVASMGVGGLAGLGGRSALGAAAKKAGEEAVKKATASELAAIGAEKIAQEAAEKVLGQAVTIGQAAAAGSMAPVEAGGMWIDDAQKHGVENTSPIQDALFGAGSAGLEMLGVEASALGRMLGKPAGNAVLKETADTVLGRLGQRGMSAIKEGGKQFVNEGILEEAGQEGLAMVNEALNAVPGEVPDITNMQGIKRLAESGIIGGVAGFAPGTVMGSFRHKTQDRIVPEVKGTTDILADEIVSDGFADPFSEQVSPGFTPSESVAVEPQPVSPMSGQTRTASQFTDLLEEKPVSLDDLVGMNPQSRQLEMLHQSRLNPSASDMLKQSFMADVAGAAGFPSDIVNGQAAQSAEVFENQARQTERGKLAGVLNNLAQAKQQAEIQAQEQAVTQSIMGAELLRQRLEQEEQAALQQQDTTTQNNYITEQQIQPQTDPEGLFGLQNTQPVEMPRNDFDPQLLTQMITQSESFVPEAQAALNRKAEMAAGVAEKIKDPADPPDQVDPEGEKKRVLPAGSRIEWNDKRGNTLAGTITGVKGARYEIERENPQPGQGKKTFLHTGYDVRAVEPKSNTEKKNSFSRVNTNSSELAEGFDPLKTLLAPPSEDDIRAAETERQQQETKKSQLVSAIEDLKQRKEKLVADRDSWASREYKGNSQTVTTGGQDEYDGSTTRTISQLNEGRRNSKIKGFSEQYRETDAAIKALEHRLKTGKYDIQKTKIGDDYLIPEIDEFEGERMPEYQIEKTTSPPVSKTPLETMQNEKASLEQKPNKSAEDWQRIDDLAYGIDDIKQGKEPDMSLIGGEMTDFQKKEAAFYRQKQNLYDQKNKLKNKITSAEGKLEKMGAMTPPSVKSEVSAYIHKLYDEMESLDNSIDAAYSEEEKQGSSNYDSVAEGQKEPDSLSDFMEQIENERASYVLKATLNAIDNNSAWEKRPELKPYEDRIRQAITDRIDTLNAEYDDRDRERELKRQSQKEATQKGTFPVADDKLTAVDEITERIKSIESQIERLESTGTGKSVVAWGNKYEKIKKLNERKDVLWIKRAGLIKSSKVAPESQLGTTETYSVIGKNADGRDIFEDKNGIRSYLDGNIRHTEPVGVTPKGEIIAGTNQKRYDNYRHEFLTNDEIESFSPKKTNTENDHDLEKSGESTLERVQADDVQGVAEGGKIERGVERSGKENTRGHERTGESGVSEPRSMGDGEGEIPVSSGRGRTDGRRGSERSGEVLHGVREGNEQDSSGGGRKLTPDEKPAGIHEKAGDFSISKDDAIGEGGAKTKFKNNIAAIKLLARINKENRPANKEEQKILAKYVGWGGIPQAFYRENGSVSAGWDKEAKELKETLPENEYLSARRSTQDAHYTSTEIVKSIWDAVKRLGFRKGRVLEPSVGVGNFIGLIPRELKAKTRVTGVELDPTTGGIAKLLYPNEDIHTATGFQDFNTPDNYFDIAVGNPPFGSTKLFDSRRKEISRFSIHNYFFAKSIDAIRPGGLLAMVVSSNFMDAANSDARKYIAEKANLVAAWRLPNNAFLKNAGTEVTTDIIILQKRDSDTDPNGVDWIGISSVKDPEGRGDVPLNEYFVKKPGNMFGRFGLYGSMYRPDMPALVAVEGQNTAGLLAEAINSLPENIFKNTEKDPVKEVVIDPADITGVKVGSMFIKDGAVFLRGENVLNRPTYIERQIEGRAFERVSGMIGIRDAFTTLRRLQLSETAKDSEIDAARQRLNTLYDAFVKKNGFVLSEANKRLFREDPTWPQLAALEEQYDKGISRDVAKKTGEEPRQASAKKAAIFSKRTQYPYTKPTAAKNAKDALSISLSQKGDLDLEYMQSLYGKGEEEITRELKGLIFKTPAGEFQTREQYLNGNVKKKLAEAIEAAKTDPLFNDNIDALKAVQPADIEPVDINVKPGSHWIPASDIKAFISHISGTGDVEASYVPANAKWYISIKNTPESAETRWGTPRAYVGEIIAAVLNQGQITIKDRTDDGGSEINHEETAAANNKISLVKEEWNNWVWDDDDRRARLARIYNDNFNTDNLVPHDGSHLSFPGKVGDDIIKLRPHQANAVWRIMQDGKALLDHVVGAGKTFTMIAAAMEMRRTGISKKPLFVVPNHLVSQWAGDFVRLYPGAEILAASKKDFEKSNRKRLFERITTGDWDAVIIAHSSFVKMPVEPEFEARFLNEQLLDLEESISAMRETEGRNARSVKQQEKMRDNLKAKLQKVMDRTEKDDVVNFGELGVDSLFVDEAHEFKNLAYFTSLQRVGGVTSGQGSNKASDLYMKARQVMNSTGGKNVVFATGTPISNSMAEMFTIQRYLDYDNLKDQGLSHFDAWARMFGEVVTDWELSPAGKYQLRGRFSKFVNMPELLSKYRGFADVINREDIIRQLKERGQTLPVPKIKGGKPQNIITERSPEQAAYIGVPKIDPETQQEEYPVGSLVWRSEHLPKGKPQKGDDNMLVIMNDARKAALDMRLINPNAPDFAGSKVNTCARNIKELYDEWDKDKGAQLVFCDLSTPKKAVASAKAEYEKLLGLAENGDDEAIVKLDRMSPDDIDALNSQFSVYDDLKEKLVRLGIPSREIAFIHDANTDIQKEELFAKVRSGKIRVLVGSSSKMGAGMNVQERLVALHHLDAPWRPSDLEQREGRIIRQGNRLYEADPEGFEVSIMRYASEQTLDSRMWQIIETKARFIEQVRKGNLDSREIEDVEGEAANAAEMKAASSGNPLILEENDLRTKIKKLEDEKKNHDRSQHNIKQKISGNNRLAARRREKIKELESDMAVIPKFSEDFYLNGKKIDKRKEAGAKLLSEIRSYAETDMSDSRKVGRFGEFSIELEGGKSGAHEYLYVRLVREGVYGYEASFALDQKKDDVSEIDGSGLITRIENSLKRIPEDYDSALKAIRELEADMPKLEKQIQAWNKTGELARLKERHREVIDALKPRSQEQPNTPKENEGETNQDEASGIKYSISESNGQGLPKSRISEALKQASRIMAFEVVQSESELPSHIKDDIGSKGFSGRAEALFDPETGTAYFIADNIGSVKAAQTGFLENLFRHEGRHAVISQMFENKGSRNLFMDRASRLFKADVEKYLADNGLENTKENVRTAAEEALVSQAVKGGVQAVIDEFLGKVVRWARRIFPNLSMTRAEARVFIRKADSALEGEKISQKEAFSGKSDGKEGFEGAKFNLSGKVINRQIYTDAFKKWFGDWENKTSQASVAVDKKGFPRVFRHSSETDNITVFKSGASTGLKGLYEGKGSYGIWFYDESEIKNPGRGYGDFGYDVFLNIRNPADMTNKNFVIDIMKAVGGNLYRSFSDKGLINHQTTYETTETSMLPEYQEYKNQLYNKYGNNIYREATDSEINELERLERAAFSRQQTIKEIIKRPKEQKDVFLKSIADDILSGNLQHRKDNYDIKASIFRFLKKKGFDGVIVNDVNFGDYHTSYVVFTPEQIKSATGNTGSFDPSNPDIRYSLKDREPATLADLGISTEYRDVKKTGEDGSEITEKHLTITGNFKDQYRKLMPMIGGEYKFQKKPGARGVSARITYQFKNPSNTVEQDIVSIIRGYHELERMGLSARFREGETGRKLFVDGDRLHLAADEIKKVGGKFVKPNDPGKKPFIVFNDPDVGTMGRIAGVFAEVNDTLARMRKVARDRAEESLNAIVKPKDESAKAMGRRILEDVKSLFSESDIKLPSNNTDFVKGLHQLMPEADIARNDSDMKALYDINEKYDAIATQWTTRDREATKDYYDLDKEERKPVNRGLLAGDDERVNMTDEEAKARFDLSDRQVKGFRAYRNVLDDKLKQIVSDMMKHAFADLYFDDGFASQLIGMTSRKELVSLLKDHGVNDKQAESVSWLFDWINERKGYVPHKWDSEWLVRVNMPDGDTYLLDVPTITGNILPTKALREGAANKAAVRVIKERIGWSDEQIREWIDKGNIKLVRSKKMDVDLFHGASMHTMSAIIDSATDRAWEEQKDAFTAEQLMKQADLKAAIRKEMEELFLVKGAGRHFIARKGVKGFRTDLDNILSEYVGGMNHWIVKRDKAMELSKAMANIDPKETPVKFRHARTFVDDMLGESNDVPWFKKFAGIWFLGADVSAAALNGFQNFTHAAPLLTRIKGKGTAHSQIVEAMKDCFGEWNANRKTGEPLFTSDSEKFLSGDEKKEVRKLYEEGFFDPAAVGEQTGFHPSSIWNNYADRATKVMMSMFTGVEALNRVSTFVAAYRRAKDAGVSDPVKTAKDIVIRAHFPGGKKDRPMLIRKMGAFGNIGYTFMMYPVNNFIFLKNIFKDALKAIHAGDKNRIKQELKVVGSHFAALTAIGGLSAWPFMSLIAPVVKGIFSDDDDDWEVALRKHLSPEAGRLLVRGIPAVLGNDMSGRVSGDITGMPAGFGVMNTMYKRALKAGDYLVQGEKLDALMMLMPDVIRNPYTAIVGMSEGGERSGRPPVKYTGWQAFNKALGFSPTAETEAYAAKQSLENVKNKKSSTLEDYAERLIQYRKKGDSASIDRLRKSLAEYNDKQKGDDDPVIQWKEIMKSANQRQKMRNKGLLDRLPKKMAKQREAVAEAMDS